MLAYKDVHEFWRETLGEDLPDIPLNINQVKRLITATGWSFRWREYRTNGAGTAHTLYYEASFRLLAQNRNGVSQGIIYPTPAGLSHCVVTEGIYSGLLNEFSCFQNDKYGEDVSSEVKRADSLIAFTLLCPPDSKEMQQWMDRRLWRVLERRCDPTWNEKRLKAINHACTVLGLEPFEDGTFESIRKSYTALAGYYK